MSGEECRHPQGVRDMTPTTLAWWLEKETGSWEDNGCPVTGHVYPLLARYKTRIRWWSVEELDLLIRSAEYQAGGWDAPEDLAPQAAVGRALDDLCHARSPEPAPTDR